MNRVLIVTGGARGIGAATARLAGECGYALCVNYLRNAAAAEGVVGELQAAGGRASAVNADVGVEADVIRMFDVAARLGGPGEYVDYAAAKGAIDTITVGLARRSRLKASE